MPCHGAGLAALPPAIAASQARPHHAEVTALVFSLLILTPCPWQIQREWSEGSYEVVVATIAFGEPGAAHCTAT